MQTLKTWLAATVMFALTGAAYAAPVFQGRLANGSASSTCTVSGATKCAMFYSTTLDITILNDWNIGRGFWSATAAAGSAQALVESAGAAQTDFTGWLLPTGDGSVYDGARNQYRSIWNDVGNSRARLQAQFDGVTDFYFWSSTEYAANQDKAWYLLAQAPGQLQFDKGIELGAVAVRPGDVATSVPEPQTLALALVALAATVVTRSRRRS